MSAPAQQVKVPTADPKAQILGMLSQSATKACFASCVSYPEFDDLTNKERTCIFHCTDRYLEAGGIVYNALAT